MNGLFQIQVMHQRFDFFFARSRAGDDHFRRRQRLQDILECPQNHINVIQRREFAWTEYNRIIAKTESCPDGCGIHRME